MKEDRNLLGNLNELKIFGIYLNFRNLPCADYQFFSHKNI